MIFTYCDTLYYKKIIYDVFFRVVTGLRFVKNNQIIHLQIQEGELLPYGKIDESTVRWVPVNNYKTLDRNLYNEQDFFTLTWDKRSLQLDDIECEKNFVVTGNVLSMFYNKCIFKNSF